MDGNSFAPEGGSGSIPQTTEAVKTPTATVEAGGSSANFSGFGTPIVEQGTGLTDPGNNSAGVAAESAVLTPVETGDLTGSIPDQSKDAVTSPISPADSGLEGHSAVVLDPSSATDSESTASTTGTGTSLLGDFTPEGLKNSSVGSATTASSAVETPSVASEVKDAVSTELTFDQPLTQTATASVQPGENNPLDLASTSSEAGAGVEIPVEGPEPVKESVPIEVASAATENVGKTAQFQSADAAVEALGPKVTENQIPQVVVKDGATVNNEDQIAGNEVIASTPEGTTEAKVPAIEDQVPVASTSELKQTSAGGIEDQAQAAVGEQTAATVPVIDHAPQSDGTLGQGALGGVSANQGPVASGLPPMGGGTPLAGEQMPSVAGNAPVNTETVVNSSGGGPFGWLGKLFGRSKI
ncbi:hypothetical protein M1146_07420 [Patescibacteria group bacterium]|nr:hypothetical protein [Patescibacteria group bacterium]